MPKNIPRYMLSFPLCPPCFGAANRRATALLDEMPGTPGTRYGLALRIAAGIEDADFSHMGCEDHTRCACVCTEVNNRGTDIPYRTRLFSAEAAFTL